MKHQRQRVHATLCPHCDERALVRSSKMITPLVRQVYYRCDNDVCGHEFVAQIGITHSTRASATPRVGIHLPIRTALTLDAVAAVPPKATEPADFAKMLEALSVEEAQPKAA